MTCRHSCVSGYACVFQAEVVPASHARAGLPPARREPGSAASTGAEEPGLRGAISALLCGTAGALELAVDARLPRGAVISINRSID